MTGRPAGYRATVQQPDEPRRDDQTLPPPDQDSPGSGLVRDDGKASPEGEEIDADVPDIPEPNEPA